MAHKKGRRGISYLHSAKHAKTNPLDIKTKDTTTAIEYQSAISNLNLTGTQTDPIIRL